MGDPQQLPPVAPGYPLRDIISKNLMPAVKLMQVHRQGGPLKAACCGILEGECAEETSPVWYPRNVTTKNYLDTILDVLDALDEEGFDSLEDVQVLTPFRKTRDELNKALQAFYNEENLAGRRGDDEILTIGDKVMQERNDYELGVFNGEVGVVEDEIPETSLTVRFDDRRVVYSFDARDNFGARRNPQRNLRLAYAMTVHKSQGSEYPIVIVAVPTLPDEKSLARNLLHRNMLYTAVTRARERVYLLTGRGALRHMLATLSMDERTTYLSQLREETGQS
jgi:exodeoxyribonuclease V alpha subunit